MSQVSGIQQQDVSNNANNLGTGQFINPPQVQQQQAPQQAAPSGGGGKKSSGSGGSKGSEDSNGNNDLSGLLAILMAMLQGQQGINQQKGIQNALQPGGTNPLNPTIPNIGGGAGSPLGGLGLGAGSFLRGPFN